MGRIYLDHAATTPVRREVLDEMLPFYTDLFGNPSSIHSFGREVRQHVNIARDRVARALGAEPDEIVFTGGGSEANNLAIKGMAFAQKGRKNHIITSAIEHHAVLDTAKSLESMGFSVTVVPVDGFGMVDPGVVAKAINHNTFLITIMHANNEVGTIQPIEEIGKIAREAGVYFHTDAVQSVGHVPIDVKFLDVDMLSLSAHKFYGPKGVGALYLRKGVKPFSLIHGGGQERKRRAGTENVAGVVGMGKAIELAVAEMDHESQREKGLSSKLINGLFDAVPAIQLNGHRDRRLPNNVNISFRYVEGESLLLNLDMEGIAASSGSACTSGSLAPSHVLMAMGIPHEIAHGSLRMTLGRANTEQDIDVVLEVLPRIVEKLREMSPIYVKSECAIREVCANAADCNISAPEQEVSTAEV